MGTRSTPLSRKTLERRHAPGLLLRRGRGSTAGEPTQSRVGSSATPAWQSREMGLGSVRDASRPGRAKASEARRQLTEGVDPLAAREGRKNEERLRKAGRSPSRVPPRNTSRPTGRAGGTPSTPSSGRTPSTPTLTRRSASSRGRRGHGLGPSRARADLGDQARDGKPGRGASNTSSTTRR